MGQFAADHQLSQVATKPFIAVVSDGAILPEVSQIIIGSQATPDDQQFAFSLVECTDIGTGGTPITPKPCGPSSPSSAVCRGGTFTADPTVTGIAYVALPVYARSKGQLQKAYGEGYRPNLIAANRGVLLQTDMAGAALLFRCSLNWWE